MKIRGYERIVLATDGSAQAAAAVGVTRSFAHSSGARVRVVHVWNLEVHHRHGVWDVETRAEANRLIDETVYELRAGGIDADGEIVRAEKGLLASAVAGAARQFGADLVVVGSRGLSEWQSMIKHSTSHELLGKLDCPVLVVRSNSSAAAHDAQRVLLAVAGPEDMPTAVEAAIAAAAAAGSEVMVAHVRQSYVGAQGFAFVEPEQDIRSTVTQAVSRLKDAGITAQSVIAHAGPVAQSVAELAANWNADVIVLGSSRMGDFESLLLGSVTHQLLRTSDKPVLVAERRRS
ncbi:MAG: universal stress protein [Candidatus Dormibacterales bacterium]